VFCPECAEWEFGNYQQEGGEPLRQPNSARATSTKRSRASTTGS
jgi:hypothetical protein